MDDEMKKLSQVVLAQIDKAGWWSMSRTTSAAATSPRARLVLDKRACTERDARRRGGVVTRDRAKLDQRMLSRGDVRTWQNPTCGSQRCGRVLTLSRRRPD
jgi:hypothetical protein